MMRPKIYAMLVSTLPLIGLFCALFVSWLALPSEFSRLLEERTYISQQLASISAIGNTACGQFCNAGVKTKILDDLVNLTMMGIGAFPEDVRITEWSLGRLCTGFNDAFDQ